jgi:hypothetical protein
MPPQDTVTCHALAAEHSIRTGRAGRPVQRTGHEICCTIMRFPAGATHSTVFCSAIASIDMTYYTSL